MAGPYQTKQDDGDFEERENLVAAVKTEISDLGKNITGILKDHEDFKGRLNRFEKKYGDRLPSDVKSQIDKMANAIAAQQERIDMFDVARQRPSFIDIITDEGEAKAFYLASLSLKAGKDSSAPITPQQLRQFMAEEEGTFEEYREAFTEQYLRHFDPQAPGNKMTPEAMKAMMVGAGPEGGYLVTPQMSARITERIYELDPIRALAAVETITTSALEWMVDIDDAGSGWEGETESGAETDTPQWRKKRIPVHVLYAKPRASMTLMEDAGINVEDWLAKKCGSRFARVEGAAFVNGDGVGKPRGFLTYPNGTDWGQVEQVAIGTVAGTIDCDSLIDLKYSLKEDFLNRCTWLMRRTTVAQVMQLKDGMGNYIWKPGLIGEDPLSSSLLGLPVRMSPTMPAVVASALSFILADWDEFYVIADRVGISVQRDPFTVKPMVEFYTRKRVGGDIGNFEAAKIGRVNP